MAIYETGRWKHKRIVILKRDEYMCRECKRYGKTTAATTVHHVIPVENNPEFAYVNINLLSLCNSCHDAMHDRNTDKLTKLGMQWVDRLSLSITPPPLRLTNITQDTGGDNSFQL